MSESKIPAPLKIIVVAALLAAARSAYGSGDLLAYMGIAYYLVCITALVVDHPRTGWLLLFAVAVHAVLTSYAVWRWQALGIIPCHFCLLAAGFALLAAVIYHRPRLAALPLALMVAVWWAWPLVFVDRSAPSPPPAIESTGDQQPGLQQTEQRSAETGPESKTIAEPEKTVNKSTAGKKPVKAAEEPKPTAVEPASPGPASKEQPDIKPSTSQPAAPPADNQEPEKPSSPPPKPSAGG
ncbi:MAG: hypothetical protein HPY50_18230 [Firmicutes bacterium]|nr:hypothetical protein [Bacillota bacterium]